MMDNVNRRKTSTKHYSETMYVVFKCAKHIRSPVVPSEVAYEQSVVFERLLNMVACMIFSARIIT